MRTQVRSLALLSGLKDPAFAMSCAVGHRHSSDLIWLWLWHRPGAAAVIQPLAWEPPYAMGMALKRPKQKTNKQKKKEKKHNDVFGS